MEVLTLLVGFALLAVSTGATCGNEWFDQDSFMCCDGVISARPLCACRDNHQCCEKVGFDNSNFMCCYGSLLRRPDYDTENHQCCQDENGHSQALNNERQMCCNGVVNTRPSGKSKFHKCCGTEAFNQETASCKDGIIIPHL